MRSTIPILLFALILVAHGASGAEIRGTVGALESDTVIRVTLASDEGARAGDRVTILWSIGGETIEVRTGLVIEGGTGSVRVQLDSGASIVSPTMTAVIESTGVLAASAGIEEPTQKKGPAASDKGADTSPRGGLGVDAEATFALGKQAFEREDWVDARRLLKAAADAGHAQAAGFYAWTLLNAKGGERNDAVARRYLELGDDGGDPFSIYNLALALSAGHLGFPTDLSSAATKYQRAADLGWVNAIRQMGWVYQNGLGVGKNEVTALGYYQEAADLGLVIAWQDLGVFYQEGRGGLEAQPEVALEWFRKAANQGDDNAMASLGRAYALGLGTPRDIELAKLWYGRASATGNEQAARQLEALKRQVPD